LMFRLKQEPPYALHSFSPEGEVSSFVTAVRN